MNLQAQLNQNELQVVTTDLVVDYIRLKEAERRNMTRYYTTEEAMKVLGIKSKTTLAKRIKEHKIRKKHGRYDKAQIDHLANTLMR